MAKTQLIWQTMNRQWFPAVGAYPVPAPMSREHTSMKRILICIVAALLPSISHAKLIGADRDEFVEGVYQSCYQANDAREKGYSLPNLARFCACFSNALADRISPEQVELLDER